MIVRLERNWLHDGYDVWLYERHPDRIWYPGNEWRAVAEGAADTPPSLTLPAGVLEALLAEAEKVIPASHATERHLADSIAVRDRLLVLVEKGWEA